MARGINKAILVGNLGADPEIRYTPNGDAVANFSLATTESYKDKETGEKTEKTEWHRVVAFKKLAEIVGEYLRKGSQVYIEGKIRTRKWQDKEGQDRYTTEIVAVDMQMLGVAPSKEQTSYASNANNKPNQTAVAPQSQQDSQGQGDYGDFDDDIPF